MWPNIKCYFGLVSNVIEACFNKNWPNIKCYQGFIK